MQKYMFFDYEGGSDGDLFLICLVFVLPVENSVPNARIRSYDRN